MYQILVTESSLKEVLSRHKLVFHQELRKLKQNKAKMYAIPKFLSAWPIPYSMKSEEQDRRRTWDIKLVLLKPIQYTVFRVGNALTNWYVYVWQVITVIFKLLLLRYNNKFVHVLLFLNTCRWVILSGWVKSHWHPGSLLKWKEKFLGVIATVWQD